MGLSIFLKGFCLNDGITQLKTFSSYFRRLNYKAMYKKLLLSIVLPVIALIALNYAFFYPVMEGKILIQDDIMYGEMSSRQAKEYYEQNNKALLWTDVLFSGMPAIQIGIRYPSNLITYIQTALQTTLGKSSNIYIIALLMLGFFFTLYSLKVNPWLAFAGAIAFGFSTFFIASFGAGHNAKIRTAAYIAPMIAGILLSYRGKKWLGWSIVAATMGLSVYSNHLQITYYASFIVFFIVITEGIFAVKDKKTGQWIISSSGLLVAALIGIAPNFSRLYTNYDYAKETIRGGISELSVKKENSTGGLDYEYAMGWSYAPLETFNLVYTNFTGGGSGQDYSHTKTFEEYYPAIKQNMVQQGYPVRQAEHQAQQYIASLFYWGDQSLIKGGYYVGSVVFFLFVLAALILGWKERIWIGTSVLFALLLSWGRHLDGFSHLMFEYLPLYNKFRIPSMALIILYVLMPLSGWLALQKVYELSLSKAEVKKHIRNALLITGGISIFFILISGMFSFSGINDERYAGQGLNIELLADDRQSLLINSALKTLLFCTLTASALYAYTQKMIKPSVFLITMVALITIDQLPFVRQQLKTESFVSKKEYQKSFTPSEVDERIRRSEKNIRYRVFNTTAGLSSDVFTPYHHNSIGGYHGAKLARYQDLIELQLSRQHQPSFDMLNTRYFIVNTDNGGREARMNPGACGNAWFARKITPVSNADEEMETITHFDACSEVVIDNRYAAYINDIQPAEAGSAVNFTDHNDPMHLTYIANNNGNTAALAVFSEIYYEGGGKDWIAKIDGEEVDHIRVNYLLRGLRVPPGEHRIEFIFAPPSFYTGERYSLAFSLLFFGFIGFGLFRHFKENRGNIPPSTP
jgi:hypothetical protein